MIRKKSALVDLFYLPTIEFFVEIAGCDEIYFDVSERFQKQTLRNRTFILLANKVELLSVPVLGSSKKQLYQDVKIDYNQKWKNTHIRGIQSAYGKAPFFEFFFSDIVQVFDKNLTHLYEFNLELLTVCLTLLRLPIKIILGSPDLEKEDNFDLRGLIGDREGFEGRNMMQAQPYDQMFGLDFVPNLSILDLLFCTGGEAKVLLLDSKKNH